MTGSPKQSALYSVLIHAGVIALVLIATTGKNPPIGKIFPAAFRDLPVYLPPPSLHGNSGRGGEMHNPAPATRGNAPRPDRRMFVAPSVHLITKLRS